MVTPTAFAGRPGLFTLFFDQRHGVIDISFSGVDIEAELLALTEVVVFVDLEDTDVFGVSLATHDFTIIIELFQTAFAASNCDGEIIINPIFLTGGANHSFNVFARLYLGDDRRLRICFIRFRLG